MQMIGANEHVFLKIYAKWRLMLQIQQSYHILFAGCKKRCLCFLAGMFSQHLSKIFLLQVHLVWSPEIT